MRALENLLNANKKERGLVKAGIEQMQHLKPDPDMLKLANFYISNIVTNMSLGSSVNMDLIEAKLKTGKVNFPAISVRLKNVSGNALIFSTGATCMAGMSQLVERLYDIWRYKDLLESHAVGRFEPQGLSLTNLVVTGSFGDYRIDLKRFAHQLEFVDQTNFDYEPKFYPALILKPMILNQHLIGRKLSIEYFETGKVQIVGGYPIEAAQTLITITLSYVQKYLYLPGRKRGARRNVGNEKRRKGPVQVV